MNQVFPEELQVFCDGGSRGNPGPAACAYVVISSGHIIQEEGLYLGTTTNNQAEYQAVIESLKYLSSHPTSTNSIHYYLDSLLVVNQITNKFKVKDIGLQQKLNEVNHYLNGLSKKVSFTYIPRENNSRADFIVNQTLDKHFS
jgi:ribonuclease HI